jgi:hypothetical protein
MLRRLSTWRSASRAEKAALWLIAIGFLIPSIVFIGYYLVIWIPLDAPIDLSAGRASVYHLRVNMGGEYQISIRTDNTIPFQILDCMLGLATGPSKSLDCKDTPRALFLRWKLTRSKDGSLIKQGQYVDSFGGGYSNTNIDAYFAGVRVPRGAYDLEIISTRDGTALQVANPRAHVEVNNDYYVGSVIAHVLSLIAGVTLIVISCAIMAVYEWESRRRA